MKCAVCFSKNREADKNTAAVMAETMRLAPHQSCEGVSLGVGGHLAVVKTTSGSDLDIPFLYQENGNVLAVSGVPVDMREDLGEKLKRIVRGDGRQAAELLKTIDGAFSCCYWDDQNGKLVIATDFLGFQPVYLLQTGEHFLIASELKAIAASGLLNVEMDLAGWGALISTGAQVGEMTSLKGVRRLEPASIYTFDPKGFELTQEVYWQWPRLQRNTTWDSFDHRQLIDLLGTNIGKYSEYGLLGTVLLSGGYDSRFILALLKSLGHDPKALIVNHPDEHNNADGRLAVQVARRLGSAYSVHSSPDNFYSTNNYLDYLIRNEIATPSLYLFVANVSSFVDQQISAVWEGVTLGYILTGTHYGTENFEKYFQHNLKSLDSKRWQAAESVFSAPSIENMFRSFKERLDHEVAKYSDDCAGVNGYAISNWSRNRTALNPCQVYSNHALCFLPGMCREFMDIVGGLPYEMKKNGRLYNRIFNQYFSQVADIPVCSGGQFFMPSTKAMHQWQLKAIKAGNRFRSHRMTQGLLRRVNKSSFEWDQSRLVDRVLERADLGHPDLNNDAVKEWRSWHKYSYEKALLFYWQVWRWIMEGKIEEMKEELCRD